ncbi:hypothetical protein VHEMI06692 [[Torrubiella] hemipterigena]|uniref:Uncharacterized protein n=1 Tax=[Torrubiella] hemipterigena TaxID=1531966 RepID=A0A0A1TLJ3_9HYPO|nr:hypothetical protein VHEMI06692 [[Torrubiella] hemipterigena]
MSLQNTATPLLLTKRLTAFLHANQSPQLPTLLLTTSQGKLLAHASPNPVSVLRTHATVAGSLLAIHTSSSAVLPSALPGADTPEPRASPPPEDDDEDDAAYSHDDDEGRLPTRSSKTRGRTGLAPANSIKPVTITVQLTQGTVIIRRLKCGLLFVCIGPSAADAAPADLTADPRGVDVSYADATITTSGGSPSDVESLASAGAHTTTSLDSTTATSVVAMRRHAAELARWLDDRLSTLKVPEESVALE